MTCASIPFAARVSAAFNVSDTQRPVAKITRIGVKDVFGESGPAKELLHKYELYAEGIAKRIMEEQKSC